MRGFLGWNGQLAPVYLLDMVKNILEVKDLHKFYGKNEAVKGISFEVKKGEIFGILGPNGAGKTTTL
jgi:ABC-2 type transport system ATP-binding protein